MPNIAQLTTTTVEILTEVREAGSSPSLQLLSHLSSSQASGGQEEATRKAGAWCQAVDGDVRRQSHVHASQ